MNIEYDIFTCPKKAHDRKMEIIKQRNKKYINIVDGANEIGCSSTTYKQAYDAIPLEYKLKFVPEYKAETTDDDLWDDRVIPTKKRYDVVNFIADLFCFKDDWCFCDGAVELIKNGAKCKDVANYFVTGMAIDGSETRFSSYDIQFYLSNYLNFGE